MRTLIPYATKYGATKLCAEKIAALLGPGTDLLELTDRTQVDLLPYDTIIIGSSIYIGRPRREAKRFCESNLDVLLQKKIGLFLCCMQDQENEVAAQLAQAYPEALRGHAAATAALGGLIAYDELRGLDRFIMKMIAGDLYKKTGTGPVLTLNDGKIAAFVAEIRA